MNSSVALKLFLDGARLAHLAEFAAVDPLEVEDALRSELRTIRDENAQYVDPGPCEPLKVAVERIPRKKASAKQAHWNSAGVAIPKHVTAEKVATKTEPSRHQSQVLDALRSGPQTMAAIAEAVNPDGPDPIRYVGNKLYGLQQKGLVTKDDSRPALWSLV